MDLKTPSSFFYENITKKKHCNGSEWVHNKTRKQGELQHRLPCSRFEYFNLSFRSEHRFKKELTKTWFVLSISHEFPERHMEK